ncbi:Molybdopterin biosynthesis MoeB protein [Spironucleus salmonicida]|uniref:Molybdopterin biosynthesis MoeB protein n=1 Tax=Spironucleus salmonicida TaxID=348837 RepID=V6LEY5_9EUKA|nr:Molybdopterin biosynthesis MoeB protein [Spironucleus salmonicida]|eukprot:EST43095.1 Molybdopterin biosynthesis MoeB protein [Spironucleus salmonicida]
MSRYNRHDILPHLNLDGPLKTKIAVIGAGGVGSPLILYLAGAGASLDIYDFDVVDVTNLHRQIIHTEPGVQKAQSAAMHAMRLNPEARVTPFNVRLTSENISMIGTADAIIDTSDNPETRILVAEFAFQHSIPHLYAACARFQYQIVWFNICPAAPCFCCVFTANTPPAALQMRAASHGVLGPATGVASSLAACELIKFAGNSELCLQGLLLGSVLDNSQRVVAVQPRAGCAWCGGKIMGEDTKE